MSDAERKLWWHLRRLPHPGFHFRRQATIGPYFADFACHEKKLVIEVDGSQHGEARNLSADADRTAFLKARGYHVLRFWNNEVLQQIDGVLATIYEAIACDAHPFPPPLTPPRHAARGWRGKEKL